MPKLKVLSGKDVIKIFGYFKFFIVDQKGSHIKLKRIVEKNNNQTLTIPNHQELDKGTLKAIFNHALRYIPENKSRGYFYNKPR